MTTDNGIRQGEDSESSYVGYILEERRIYVRGFVDERTSFNFATVFDQMRGRKPITVDITSRGGDPKEGLDIFNRIRNSGCPVITVTFGGVSSVAFLIFLAGDERLMAADTLAGFHWPVLYYGERQETADTLKNQSDFSGKLFTLLNKIISKRTGIPIEKVANYCRHSKAFDGGEAKALGIATEVFDGKESLVKAVRKSVRNIVTAKIR